MPFNDYLCTTKGSFNMLRILFKSLFLVALSFNKKLILDTILTDNYLKFQDLVLFYLTFYGFVACTQVT